MVKLFSAWGVFVDFFAIFAYNKYRNRATVKQRFSDKEYSWNESNRCPAKDLGGCFHFSQNYLTKTKMVSNNDAIEQIAPITWSFFTGHHPFQQKENRHHFGSSWKEYNIKRTSVQQADWKYMKWLPTVMKYITAGFFINFYFFATVCSVSRLFW